MACRPCLAKQRREAWRGSRALRPAVLVVPEGVRAMVDEAKRLLQDGDLEGSAARWGDALQAWRLTIDAMTQGPERQSSLNQWGVSFREVQTIRARAVKG